MFPSYFGGSVLKNTSEVVHDSIVGTQQVSDEDEDNIDDEDPEDAQARKRY